MNNKAFRNVVVVAVVVVAAAVAVEAAVAVVEVVKQNITGYSKYLKYNLINRCAC